MERHINVVAALHIGLSILGLIIGIIVFAVLNITGSFVDEMEARKILAIIANVLVIIITSLSIPGLIAGIGLFKRIRPGMSIFYPPGKIPNLPRKN